MSGMFLKKDIAHLKKVCYKYLVGKTTNKMDGFPSGQRGQTVNLLQLASVVRIHLCPFVAGVAELADAQDLKSCGTNLPYRFDSGRRQ